MYVISGPRTCTFEIRLSQYVVLCIPRSPETFADCAKSYIKPWSVYATLQNRKNRSRWLCECVELSYLLRTCWKNLNFLVSYFSVECTFKMPRENYLDKELPELVPLWRKMIRTTLSRSFLTAKIRITTFKLKKEHWQYWTCFYWYARHCRSNAYHRLILGCKTHFHAVKNTNVEVMADGDSERCLKFDFFWKLMLRKLVISKAKKWFWMQPLTFIRLLFLYFVCTYCYLSHKSSKNTNNPFFNNHIFDSAVGGKSCHAQRVKFSLSWKFMADICPLDLLLLLLQAEHSM